MGVDGNTALDILLVRYNQLLKENILLTTRVLELEDKLKEVEINANTNTTNYGHGEPTESEHGGGESKRNTDRHTA